MASKPKPWEHLYHRDGTAYWWARFIVYDLENRPRTVRRSTDETDKSAAKKAAHRIYVEETMKAGGKLRDDCPMPERVRKPVEDAVIEYIRDRLNIIAAKFGPHFGKRREKDLNLYVVPKSDADLAEIAALRAKQEGQGRKLKPMWQPPWRFVDEITASAWADVLLRLHRSNPQTGLLRWASLHQVALSLRDFLVFAATCGWIDAVPDIKTPERKDILKDQQERRALSLAERDELLGFMRHEAEHGVPEKRRQYREAHRHYTLMFCNLFRKSTVERMTRRWIKDWQTGVVEIPRSSYKVVTSKPIRVVLHPQALAAVKSQIAENDERRKPGEPIDLDAPIFGTFDHKTLFWQAVKRIGLDPDALVAHHIGRHTGATLLGKAGATDRELMSIGGWKSPAMLARYAHLDEELARRAMEKMP